MTRSKTHEGRDVGIEDNLLHWISRFSKGRTSGPVVRTTNLRTHLEDLRADLGFKVRGRNSMAKKWPEDVLRHTYASNWLSMYKDRPRLAEYMGNSPRIIGQKYHRPVPEKMPSDFGKLFLVNVDWIESCLPNPDLQALGPFSRVFRAVVDLVNSHQAIVDPVKECVLELPWQSLPIALHHWKNLWVPLDKSETSREGSQKLMA